MKIWFIKINIFFLFAVAAGNVLFAQTSFIDIQKSTGKIFDVHSKVEDSLKKQFAEKKLQWPPNELYIRSFKYDRQLEVWVKNEDKETFKFSAFVGLPVMIVKERSYPGRPLFGLLTNSRSQAFNRW